MSTESQVICPNCGETRTNHSFENDLIRDTGQCWKCHDYSDQFLSFDDRGDDTLRDGGLGIAGVGSRGYWTHEPPIA